VATASGKDPALRVSDADREAAVTELGRHFQDGRLDQNEFDERIGLALSARTERDLAGLMIDLPRTGQLAERAPDGAIGPLGPGRRRPPLIALVPVAFAVFVIADLATGGWHHGTGWGGWGGWPFAPLRLFWLVIPLLAIRAWARGSRRRQYRSEGGR
jgi:Domain of unknown function (DUF1707)